ncbi:MAG: tryptophan-rich sensory protein [Eubacteriales bacterium]
MKQNDFLSTRIANLIAFIAVFVVNMLSAVGLINNLSPQAVSDSFPNLFAPAGLTFSIWGVIYILLALFALYGMGLFRGKSGGTESIRRIGPYFIISSIANIAWIFSWHYKIIPLSMVLMLVILVTLIITYMRIVKEPLTSREKAFVRLPFSVYLGWITIATIANVTVLLVSLGWNGFGLAPELWTNIILIIGLAIGAIFVLRYRDIAFGLVLAWAYLGILIKHTTTWGSQYPSVITTVTVLLFVGVAVIIIAAVLAFKKKKI